MSQLTTPDPLQAVVLGFGMAGKGLHAALLCLSPHFILRGILIHSYVQKTEVYEQELTSFCQMMNLVRDSITIYTSYEEILDDREKIDLLVVATPNDSHLAYTKRAYQDGFNVVVDKPVVINLEEWYELKSMLDKDLREKAPLVSVFHNRRLDGDFLTVSDLLSSAQLGTLMHMELSWQMGLSSKQWKCVPVEQGGGRWFDLGVHMLDQVLELLCRQRNYRCKSVYCDMKFDKRDAEISSICHIRFVRGDEDDTLGEYNTSTQSPQGHLAREVSVILDTSTLCMIEKPRFLLVGTKGTYAKYGVDPQERCLFAGDIHSAVESEEEYGILTTLDTESKKRTTRKIATLPGKWLAYYDNIAETIRDRKHVQPIVDISSMDLLMRIMNAAVVSARSGKVVNGDEL